jgi:regulator of protease activity HflC (stomatin/prohibitin superfamily)
VPDLAIAVTVLVALAAFATSAITVVQAYERGVIFRQGRLVGARGPRLFCIIPGLEAMRKVDPRILTMDVPAQEAITRDDVTVKVNAVVYFRVVDPENTVVKVVDAMRATSLIAQTILRGILGQSDLDRLLSEREKINQQLQHVIDEQTDAWGVKVTAVEVRDVELPQTMQRYIARQAEAEREKWAKVIHAEGEYSASQQLAAAAQVIGSQPSTLQLRYPQTLAEIAAEKNSTIVFRCRSSFSSPCWVPPLACAVTARRGTRPGRSRRPHRHGWPDGTESRPRTRPPGGQPCRRAAASAAGQAAIVGEIKGIIDPVMAGYAGHVIGEAERSNAAVVSTLDTPGGLSDATHDIDLRILAARVPVVVYVASDGARAGSTRVYLTYAAHPAAMAPATNIGSATPVVLGEGGEQQLSPEMRAEVTNDAVAGSRAPAEQRGRDTAFAERAVRDGADLEASQALQSKAVNHLAADVPDPLRHVDGARVQLARRRHRVGTGREALIGAVGPARTDIAPGREGVVQVQGERWRAVTGAASIGSGERGSIGALNGLVLHIRPPAPRALEHSLPGRGARHAATGGMSVPTGLGSTGARLRAQPCAG